jgi:hypothetical protein
MVRAPYRWPRAAKRARSAASGPGRLFLLEKPLAGWVALRRGVHPSRGSLGDVDALDDALRVIASLNDAGVDYVVVGGVALNILGLVRATEDLDVFVRPDPANIQRLRVALKAVWADPDIDQITAEDLCGDYPAVRYGPPQGTLYLDILTRLGEATTYSDLQVQEKEIEGVRVRVATPETLYRMKRNTVRPIDRADAAALRSVFHLTEEE